MAESMYLFGGIQFFLFDLQQGVGEIAKSLYAVGRGSFQLIRLAVECRRNVRVIICSWERIISVTSIGSRV